MLLDAGTTEYLITNIYAAVLHYLYVKIWY